MGAPKHPGIKGRGSTGYLPGRFAVTTPDAIDDGWHDADTEGDIASAPQTRVIEESARSVITRTALVQRIWGQDWFGDDHVLDVHMSSLRRKIGDPSGTPRFITTVRGVGYRFVGTAPDQT